MRRLVGNVTITYSMVPPWRSPRSQSILDIVLSPGRVPARKSASAPAHHGPGRARGALLQYTDEISLVGLARQHAPRARAGLLAAAPDHGAVDDGRDDALRRLDRLRKARGFIDLVFIEHDHIRRHARLQDTPVREAEGLRRKPGHLVNCIFQRKETQVPGIVAEYPRERSPPARVRRGAVRPAVRADHSVLEAWDALTVLLVHREVDRAGGGQLLGGLFNAQSHL